MQKEQAITFVKVGYPNISHAKACKLFNCSRTKCYYQKKMPEKDMKIKEIIEKNIGTTRIGRNKVIVKIQRKNPELSGSKIRRVYEMYGFALLKRLRKKRANNPANPIEESLEKNEQWSIDFMSDTLTSGSKIRTLNVIDNYNRECVLIAASKSIPANKLIEFLDRAIHEHGKPKEIRTDNGPEFISKVFQQWMKKNDIQWVKIQKGKPQQNALIERFNRTYREDVLDANLFNTIEELEELTALWIKEYNEERPHQSLNYKTPIEYAA